MQTHYERLGGSEVIRQLVDRFYDLMDEDPDYYGIRKLHPADLTESRTSSAWFLIGWTGGPPEYTDASVIRFCAAVIHPLPSAKAERDQWMGCMIRAMQDVGWMRRCNRNWTAALFKTADFMRNQPQ